MMKRRTKCLKAITFTRSKRRYIATAIVTVILLSVLIAVFDVFKDIKVSKCQGSRIERSARIEGTPLVQSFTPRHSQLKYIELHYADCECDEGSIDFTVTNKKGKVLYNEVLDMKDLVADVYYSYNVNLKVTPGSKYIFKVTPVGIPSGVSFRVWVSNNDTADEIKDVVYEGQNRNIRMQTNVNLGYECFHYYSYIVSFLCVLFSAFISLLCFNFNQQMKRRIACFFMAIMPLVMYCIVESLNGFSILKHIFPMIVNYFLYFAIYSLFFAITNKFRLTVLFSNILIFIIAILNFYKLEFRGEPFLFADIVSFSTAKNVASEYKIELRYMVVVTACIFMLVTAIVSRFRYSMRFKKTRVLVGVLSLSLFSFMVVSLFNTDRFSAAKNSLMLKLGIENNVWNQPKNYVDNGVLAALTMNAKYLVNHPPKVYSDENLKNVVNDVQSRMGKNLITGEELIEEQRISKPKEGKQKPNIICIMDESYSNFSQFNDDQVEKIKFSKEYSPFMDSMDKNTIKGKCYVSTFGGGTANSEFEFLTGNTMAGMPHGSIPYQQYIDHNTGSIARNLKEMGYRTVAMHPYLASGWNRPNVYDYIGFDKFYSVEDFEDEIETQDYIRSYLSDDFSFRKLIMLYEEHKQKNEDVPFFMFNVTMQNHGSYTKNYANFKPDVQYSPAPGTYPEAEQYFSVARNTDSAVKSLIEYFQNCDEPTIICFFGDHLPQFNDGFYENLLGVNDMSSATAKEMQKLYMTDFFIWANYDIEKPNISGISLNYLSTLLMQEAGIPFSSYQLFLSEMYSQFPIMTSMASFDANGTYLGDSTHFKDTDMWNYYSVLEYNNVFETNGKERKSDFFDLPFGLSEYVKQSAIPETATDMPEALPNNDGDISVDGTKTEDSPDTIAE